MLVFFIVINEYLTTQPAWIVLDRVLSVQIGLCWVVEVYCILRAKWQNMKLNSAKLQTCLLHDAKILVCLKLSCKCTKCSINLKFKGKSHFMATHVQTKVHKISVTRTDNRSNQKKKKKGQIIGHVP